MFHKILGKIFYCSTSVSGATSVFHECFQEESKPRSDCGDVFMCIFGPIYLPHHTHIETIHHSRRAGCIHNKCPVLIKQPATPRQMIKQGCPFIYLPIFYISPTPNPLMCTPPDSQKIAPTLQGKEICLFP